MEHNENSTKRRHYTTKYFTLEMRERDKQRQTEPPEKEFDVLKNLLEQQTTPKQMRWKEKIKKDKMKQKQKMRKVTRTES